jgi:hypothetical protein
MTTMWRGVLIWSDVSARSGDVVAVAGTGENACAEKFVKMKARETANIMVDLADLLARRRRGRRRRERCTTLDL